MYAERLERSLPEVRERIARALERAGRRGDVVEIVSVTKGHPAAAVRAAIGAGLPICGENRVQELAEKVAAVGRDAVEWHLIGHLQRNKVRQAIELFDLVHSVDSLRLAREISREAERAQRTIRTLVQVNVSGEESKGGFGEEAADAVAEIVSLPGIAVEGIMTMAPLTEDEGVIRRTFAGARRIFERCGRVHSGLAARHLSMGMSGDFEIAIEEGSTMVRLGTVLFGERTR